MNKNIRILSLAIGMIGLLSHAAAETPDEQRARCNAYAERAVAQYNEAAAHPQCHINVDFVWQPSREFHVAACMKVSRTVAEQTATNRDNVLQGCATAPAQAASIPLPTELKQCERSLLKFCGTWTLSGGQYQASWSNGAKGTVSVTSFDGHSIALHRVDPADSTTPGLTADYLGNVDGGKMKGKVTYTWPGHNPPVGYGTWDAVFTPAPTPIPAPVGGIGNTAPTSTTVASAPQPQNLDGTSSGDCPLLQTPVSWLNDANKRIAGGLWKIENGVLSYTEYNGNERKAVSYRVVRPKYWLRWAACVPKDFVAAAGEGGTWIWISDDRRDARLFITMSGKDHLMIQIVVVPANLVLAEEA